MDRFADRRFTGGYVPLADMVLPAAIFPRQNKALSSPTFDRITPRLLRWVADARGHVIAADPIDAAFPIRVAVNPAGWGWRLLFDRSDRRALIQAALSADCPEPVMLAMRGTDGQARWCLLRLLRVDGPGGARQYHGTLEDVHDYHDRQARVLETALAESREHYRCSVELSPQVPWTASPCGEIEELGPRWCDLTGMSEEETLGQGWIGAIHPDDLIGVLTTWRHHLDSGRPIDVDYRIRLRHGGYRWMRARAAARRGPDGAILRWYGTLEDVHATKLAQDALSDSEERFRLAVQSARLGIWDFDVVTGARRWSNEFRTMLGLPEDMVATADLALSLVHPDDRDQLAAMLDAVAAGAVPPHFEATLRIYRADNGQLRWIRSTGWTISMEEGRPRRIVVTFLDVSDQRDAEDRIRWAASHDQMTRLPNRALWQAGLENMAAKAEEEGGKFGLLLLDIDDLKRVNDSLGHDIGDALLCGFATCLSMVAPPDAILGRLGGDEFGLIAPSLTDAAALQALSARLMDDLRQLQVHQDRAMDCGVSIGGAIFGVHGDKATDLLKAADLALYASKAGGRGRLTLFHSSLRAEAQQRSSMIRMARRIIDEKLLMPYYQPKVDLCSGRVLGYEALLRWRHPRMGVQLPGTIAAAFDHGELSVSLTRLMLDAVLGDLSCWLGEGGNPGRVAINASAADFMQDDFPAYVLDRLHHFGVPPAHVEIEVVEGVFMGRGADQVAQALHRFVDAGIRVALDDFGTGFASLTHLKQYPVDVLKIDRSFIGHDGEDAGDAAIVDAIVKLGQSFGMEVVAEGVETQEQARRLLRQGCHVGQGYLFGRPQPFAEIAVPRAA